MSKSGYVNSNDSNIYYQVVGEGDSLVLLTGVGADGNTWEKHISVYQEYFQCIVIDNRGVGASDHPEGPYTTKMMARDTAAVMKKLGIKKANVIGISMGGAIAQELALNYPEKVSALILTSTWAVFDTYTQSIYGNLMKLRKAVSPEIFIESLQLRIYGPSYYNLHLDALKEEQQVAADDEFPQTDIGFENQIIACIQHNTIKRLHKIKVPTLITVGQMDIFTHPSYATSLHEKIVGSELANFPTAGHLHYREDIEKYNQLTLDFLLKKNSNH